MLFLQPAAPPLRKRLRPLAFLWAITILSAGISPALVAARPAFGESASGWTLSGPRLEVLAPGLPPSFDAVSAYQPSVAREPNGTYLMYYTGYDGARNRILGAVSVDGIHWVKLPGSIFLNDGAGSPFLMLYEGGFRMWFESVVWGPGPLGYTDRIYSATSADGFNWTIGGVVVDVGSGSDWDAGSVGDPWVISTATGYLMYFTMYAANHSAAVGVATSPDLTTFTKWTGNPVLLPGPAGSWDSSSVSNPAVVRTAPWALFYTGLGGSAGTEIGLATSQEGYHWNQTAAPFLSKDSGTAWDNAAVGGPSVVLSPNRLYFAGGNTTGSGGIGMVNLTFEASGGGPTDTVFGMPTLVFLVIMVLAAAAVAVVIALVVYRLLRRRPRGP